MMLLTLLPNTMKGEYVDLLETDLRKYLDFYCNSNLER